MVKQLVTVKVFEKQAKELCDKLGLKMKGDHADVNKKVWFFYEPVEGHPIVEIEIDV